MTATRPTKTGSRSPDTGPSPPVDGRREVGPRLWTPEAAARRGQPHWAFLRRPAFHASSPGHSVSYRVRGRGPPIYGTHEKYTRGGTRHIGKPGSRGGLERWRAWTSPS